MKNLFKHGFTYNSEEGRTNYYTIYLTDEELKTMRNFQDESLFIGDLITKRFESKDKILEDVSNELSDKMIYYKKFLLDYKKAIFEADEAMMADLEQSEKRLIEKQDIFYDKVRDLNENLKPLINNVKEIKSNLEFIENHLSSNKLYNLEKILNVIEKVKYMTSQEKEIIVELLKKM